MKPCPFASKFNCPLLLPNCVEWECCIGERLPADWCRARRGPRSHSGRSYGQHSVDWTPPPPQPSARTWQQTLITPRTLFFLGEKLNKGPESPQKKDEIMKGKEGRGVRDKNIRQNHQNQKPAGDSVEVGVCSQSLWQLLLGNRLSIPPKPFYSSWKASERSVLLTDMYWPACEVWAPPPPPVSWPGRCWEMSERPGTRSAQCPGEKPPASSHCTACTSSNNKRL